MFPRRGRSWRELASSRSEPVQAGAGDDARRLGGSRSVVGAIAVLFLLAWAALMSVRLATGASDVPRYFGYGELMRHGSVPYRDFRVEYPPLGALVFWLPAVAATGARGYRIAFEVLMGLCGCGLVIASGLILERRGGRLAAPLAFMAVAIVGLGPISLGYFDLWPALLASLTVYAVLRGRALAAAVLLGLAIAAKLYAAVLLPIFAIRLWRRFGARRAISSIAASMGVVFLCYLPFAALSPGGVFGSLREQAGRPLQVESSASAALLAAHQLVSLSVGVTFSHTSANLGGSSGQAAAAATTIAEILVLVLIWALYLRKRESDEALLRAVASAVLAFVVLGKVFSPQYLLWLIPLIPLVEGSLAVFGCAALVAAVVLTRAYFPRYWTDLLGLQSLPTWLLVSRDAVLLILLAVLVRVAVREPGSRDPLPGRPLGH